MIKDPKYPTSNLLKGGKWRSEKKWGSSVNEVTLRLEKVYEISAIDLGNSGSAFITIEVSRMGLQRYETLLSSTSLMSANDCKSKENWSCVRMLTTEDFSPSVREQKWDLIRITCLQPFLKDVQFGISFIKAFSNLTSVVEQIDGSSSSRNLLRARQPETIQAVCQPMSRSEKIVQKVKGYLQTQLEDKLLNFPKNSVTCAKEKKCTQLPSSNSLENCRKLSSSVPKPKCDSDSDSDSTVILPPPKISKKDTHVALIHSPKSLPSSSQGILQEKKKKKKSFMKGSTNNVNAVPSSPRSISSEMTDIILLESDDSTDDAPREQECPLCLEKFDASKIEEHAANCCILEEHEDINNCPICGKHFPPKVLEEHADLCAEHVNGV